MLPPIFKPATFLACHDLKANPMGLSFVTADDKIYLALSRDEMRRMAESILFVIDPENIAQIEAEHGDFHRRYMSAIQSDSASDKPSTDGSPQEGQAQ